MTREELFRKNQQLSTEFELYLLEHPEIEDNIPDNAMIVLVPEYDNELSEKNIELAEANREEGQPIVYVRVKKMRTSRIEGLTLQVA
jgi:CRISPR/Cas system-associated protein Csm6